ncbi:MAG: hypothetical protein ACMXX8_03620 [Candidatus Woesearchaeota archaeon]
MSFWNIVLSVITFIGIAILDWLKIFVYPFTHPQLLWIIIPIWLAWFFAEFFQEKRGTTFGNAISNGIVPVYVSIDWIRYLTNNIIQNDLTFTWNVFFKYFICAVAIIYGLTIIILGIRGKDFIKKYVGRIREVTYFLLMFTPIIYGVVDLNLRYIILIIIFFPIFYYLIELIDIYTPDPLAVTKDLNKDSDNSNNNNSYNQPFNNENEF